MRECVAKVRSVMHMQRQLAVKRACNTCRKAGRAVWRKASVRFGTTPVDCTASFPSVESSLRALNVKVGVSNPWFAARLRWCKNSMLVRAPLQPERPGWRGPVAHGRCPFVQGPVAHGHCPLSFRGERRLKTVVRPERPASLSTPNFQKLAEHLEGTKGGPKERGS